MVPTGYKTPVLPQMVGVANDGRMDDECCRGAPDDGCRGQYCHAPWRRWTMGAVDNFATHNGAADDGQWRC